MQMKGYLKITGIGAYLPSQIVNSDDLMLEAKSTNFGVAPEFLRRFSGIHERRYSGDGETPSSLAIEASRVAIANSGIDIKDIDQVIFCGIDKDFAEPATAHFVARALGISGTADCFDVSNACHGIMAGLSIANGSIGIGAAENILLCTGEKPSLVAIDVLRQLKGVKDRAVFRKLMGALTLGDSGGAFIVSKATSSKEGCKWMSFTSRSECADYCYYRHTNVGVEFSMEMSKISQVALQMHEDMIESTYQNLEWDAESVAKMYCHQAGEKPHIKMAELARQPLSKTPQTFKLLGNLTSATIPVNMHINPPSKGDRVLIMGVGSGLSAGQVGVVF